LLGTETADPQGKTILTLSTESTGEPMELAIAIHTGDEGKAPTLHVTYHSAEDPTERPLATNQLLLPWAPARPPASTTPPALPANLAGGDPKRGEAVFFGKEAKCSDCHKLRGRGGEIGPDLSNLVHKGAASVYRDIAEPSATINPDYVPFTVQLKDGRVAVGVVRSEGADAIKVFDTNAQGTVFPRSEIEEIRPSATSIMPVGLAGAVGEAGMKDLLAFLLAVPTEADRPKR
jgi:putative heme-binding domain-containing protein